MGRIRTSIEINGKKCWTLFDTGARNTYVVKEVAASLQVFELDTPQPVSLGGEVHKVTKICYFTAFLEGLPIQAHARVLDDIGADEHNKKIEVIIGALTMQEWGIRLIPEEEKLDMTHYPKEFVEY